MQLTKEALENITFQTKGKWYRAEQVDTFIDELAAALDAHNNENLQLKQEINRLMQELDGKNKALAAKAAAPVTVTAPAPKPVAPQPQLGGVYVHQKKVCEELEKEQDALIESIKMLRRFRENFKQSVKEDMEKLNKELDNMESNGLL